MEISNGDIFDMMTVTYKIRLPYLPHAISSKSHETNLTRLPSYRNTSHSLLIVGKLKRHPIT